MAPASAAKTVMITSHSYVRPPKPIGSIEFQLTTFDLPYLAFYYNQKLMLYNGGPGFDFDVMVMKMKRGLETALEEFYPLAGRLATDADGVFYLKYDDNMQGVEVMEALAGDVTVDELSGKQDTSAFLSFIPCNGTPNLDGLRLPLVSIQMTKLADGIALGCAFNHAVIDGSSTWHFIGSWAEACNSVITRKPVLERSNIRNTRVNLGPYLAARSLTSNETVNCNSDRVFRFSSEAIAKIKKSVNACPTGDDGKPFSTFQSLGAHIWLSVCRARELKPEDVTVFAVFMDCRRRLDPPLTESYFGNAIHAVFTHSTAGMLGGATAAAAGVGCSLIQKAVEAHDGKAIEGRNRVWESDPKIFQYRDAGVNCVVMGSSPRFKVYDVDFGWGMAETVRGGGNNRFDGMVYLYPGRAGGQSIDVEITLERGAMEKLEKDKVFLGQEVP